MELSNDFMNEKCPYCGDMELSYDDTDIDCDSYYIETSCSKCERSWQAAYRLVGILPWANDGDDDEDPVYKNWTSDGLILTSTEAEKIYSQLSLLVEGYPHLEEITAKLKNFTDNCE